MTIYFDLDGVIRDLTGYIYGRDSEIWDFKVNGEGLYEIVNKKPDYLVNAPPTKYYPLIVKLSHIKILSHQPKNWIPYAEEWLSKHFKKGQVKIEYVDNPEDKLVYLEEDDLLVEDNPIFLDYSQIILIDHKYNQEVKNPYKRIKTVEEMEEFINESDYKTF